MELSKIPRYEKGKPPRPLFDVDYLDELEATWGRKWGAQTELGPLRMVMVQAPTWGATQSRRSRKTRSTSASRKACPTSS